MLAFAAAASAAEPERVVWAGGDATVFEAPESIEAAVCAALSSNGTPAEPLWPPLLAEEPAGREAIVLRATELLQSGKRSLDRLMLPDALSRLNSAAELLSAQVSPATQPDHQEALVLLALTQLTMGRKADAEATLARLLLARPGYAPDPRRVNPDFQKLLESVRGQVGRASSGALTIRSTPAGAEISLDGMRVGKTPLTLPSVIPGSHTLRLALPGHVVDYQIVEVSKGASVDVSLQGSPLAGRRLAQRTVLFEAVRSGVADRQRVETALGPLAPNQHVRVLWLTGDRLHVLQLAIGQLWGASEAALQQPTLSAIAQASVAAPAAPAAAVAPAGEAEADTPAEGRGLNGAQGAGIGFGVLAVVAAGTAGILGGVALGTANEARALPPDAWDEWTQKATTARSLAIGADVCWGVAGAAGVGALVLLIAGSVGGPPVSVAVTPHGASVGLTLDF